MKIFNSLIKLTDILLGEEGCAWDKKQTIFTLQKFLVEETKEVLQAIESEDYENLKEELGDVLYIIIFIAKIAEINKKFDLNDVIEGIHKKIIRRHPHVFENKKCLSEDEIIKNWKRIKKEEKVSRN